MPLGLLSIDIDRFKRINDLHGHAAGDAVLVAVAERLTCAMRAGDRVLRMGGEEFLVLLPGVTDLETLGALAEHVRCAVGGTPMDVGALQLDVTISIGAACADVGRDIEALLVTTDRLLYAAKRAGRDRVLVTPAGADEEGCEDEDCLLLRLAHVVALTAAAASGAPASEVDRGAVATLAAGIARELGLPRPEVLRCRLAAVLHDLGPEVGSRLVGSIAELATVAPLLRHHHERHDGTGYPDGLPGAAIPLEARIVAAAEVAATHPEPLVALAEAAGGRLDPAVAAAARDVLLAGSRRAPSAQTSFAVARAATSTGSSVPETGGA